jgi:hypothetical protein
MSFHPLFVLILSAFTAVMDSGTSWHLSGIWSWEKTNPTDIGPLGVLLPVGLYGKLSAYLSLSQLTANVRHLHSGILNVHVDHVS